MSKQGTNNKYVKKEKIILEQKFTTNKYWKYFPILEPDPSN